MSFFFNKKKQEPKPVSKTTPANKSSKESLNRLGCKVCPLNNVPSKSPKMDPVLARPTSLYVLGESPDQKADLQGIPIGGGALGLLDSVLGDRDDISLDNVIRDINDNAAPSSWVAMEACRGHVSRSLESARPKVILGLGMLPLQWMLNSTDMVGLRGRLFTVRIGNHTCYFLPTYHPSYVLEQAFDKSRPLRGQFGLCFQFDIERALEAAKLPPPTIEAPQGIRAAIQAFNGKGPDHIGQVLKLMGEAARAPIKAIDLETSHLRPYAAGAKILTVAISYDNTNFAFALDHKDAGWTKDQRKRLVQELREVLWAHGRIVAHNTPFEVEWLTYLLGQDSIYQDKWDCTMMQAHFLDERRGKRGGGDDDKYQPNPYQALDFLIRMHFGIKYKSAFKIDRKNMAAADLDETLIYNAADTKYTLKLYHLQSDRLKSNGLWGAYVEGRNRQPTVALMQTFGIHIDQAHNRKMADRLGAEIAEVEAQIQELPEVKQFIKDRKSFNPASNPDLLLFFKDYLKVGKVILNDEGSETTNKSTLNKISHPFAKLLGNFRNYTKLKSTYVDVFEADKGSFLWPDGKIHPSFHTTFAETGRTSSSGPNQQNWTNRSDKWIRRQVVAPKDHVLVAFDYGQLEACTAAMCSKDKVLVDAMWTGYDIHMEWAIKAATIYPDFIGGRANLKNKQVMKDFRGLIKNKLVFPVIFGASTNSVGGYLRLATQTETPQHKVDALMDEFWRTFHGVAKWQRELMNAFYATGYVASPTGRRRHYPLTKSKAVNYPVQSVACDIVCRSMCTLSNIAADTGDWFLHPIMNIHDDLTFCIPADPRILEPAIETIYKVMLAPGYSFVNVPLSVSASVGEHWADMQDIGKFRSDKDL